MKRRSFNSIVKVGLFVLSPLIFFAQQAAEEEPGYLYRKAFSGGLMISTHGIGPQLQLERKMNYRYYHQFGLTLSGIRHEKEYRSKNASYDDSKPYVYGKLNSLIALRFFFGGKLELFEKKRTRGISIHYTWAAGPSVGYLKPVYLKILEPSAAEQHQDPHVERYDPALHPQENIYGRASYFEGFGEGSIRPGLFLKSGFFFDFSKKEALILGLEIGAMIDAYSKTVVLLYQSKNHQVFPAFYASLLIGKKRF